MSAGASKDDPDIDLDNIHVHWSMGPENQKEALFTLRGMFNTHRALKLSSDVGKWKKTVPTLVLYDCTLLHTHNMFLDLGVRDAEHIKFKDEEVAQEESMHKEALDGEAWGWYAYLDQSQKEYERQSNAKYVQEYVILSQNEILSVVKAHYANHFIEESTDTKNFIARDFKNNKNIQSREYKKI